MKIKALILLTVLTFVLILTACGQTSATNTSATIDAAVKATDEAQHAVQATIDNAVKATTSQNESAHKSAIDQSVQATLSAQPTPDASSMSQEEMAALIEDSVNKAMADYETATAAVTQSTSDGTVTDEEASSSYTTTYNAYYEVAYAEELIQEYYAYYGAYADEALATMNTMENDLSSMSDSLDEIATVMEQGSATATAAIDQLNSAVSQAQTKAGDVKTKSQDLQDQVKSSLSNRENGILNMPANSIAENEIGAINQANDFLDAFKASLSDGKFSPDELANIGQLAANAKASLDKTGNPKLKGLGGSIESLTGSAARGDWGNARKGMSDFERSIPKRRK
jgi:Asp-tRNA(Asn)/Glu-tRNA(Gln) amidotransferase C subunit